MALTSAISLAATALIVPGTGTPNANIVPNYMQNAVDYYLQDTFCGQPGGGCDTPGTDLIGINYPRPSGRCRFPAGADPDPGGARGGTYRWPRA